MIPRKFSRSQVIGIIIYTAFFTYFFHADIRHAGTWINQTIIQPYTQIWINFLWFIGIGGIVAFAGYGIWIFYEDQIRKYGWKLFLWGLLWYGIIAGTIFLLIGQWWLGIYHLALSFIPWWLLTDKALEEKQRGN